MIWKIEFDSDVEKDLRKLGHTAQKRILKFFKEKIATSHDPRIHGKALTGNLIGFWRYRGGTIRLAYFTKKFDALRALALSNSSNRLKSLFC